MILLAERGHSVEFLFDLDIRSFHALLRGSNRVASAQKLEAAWTMMIAAQGNQKSMKGWTKPWEQAIKGEQANDAQAFLSKFGKGI